MAIHAPGSRLYSSIPLKFIGGHATGDSKTDVSLNLTPFVDMMTILVTFLLMVFNSSGKMMVESDNFEFAIAHVKGNLQRPVPIILVEKTEVKVSFNRPGVGEQSISIGTVDDIANQSTDLIPGLQKILSEWKVITKQTAKESYWAEVCEVGQKTHRNPQGEITRVERCPDGLAILQADKDTDAKVITRIVRTAQSSDAGFKNVMFAAELEDPK